LPRKVTGQRVVQKEHWPVEDARRRQEQLAERFAELGANEGHAMQWRSGEKFNESESVINHPNPSNLPGWFSPDPRWG
jgi:hypothetical protein